MWSAGLHGGPPRLPARDATPSDGAALVTPRSPEDDRPKLRPERAGPASIAASVPQWRPLLELHRGGLEPLVETAVPECIGTSVFRKPDPPRHLPAGLEPPPVAA